MCRVDHAITPGHQTYSDKYLPLAQVVETFFLLSNVKWVGEEAEADVRNGFAVTADGQTFHGPAALVVLFSHSPVLWPLGRLFLVGPFPAMLRGFFWTVAIGLGDNTEEVRLTYRRCCHSRNHRRLYSAAASGGT